MQSHHINSEIQKSLRKERRLQLVKSITISVLVITLAMYVLSLLLLVIPDSNIEPITAIAEHRDKESDKPKETKPRVNMAKNPVPPSPQLTKLITSIAPADIMVPAPEIDVELPTVNVGIDGDFDVTWNNGRGDSTTFFGMGTRARRVAFVIDFSMSMHGYPEMLMRDELERSLKSLKEGTDYSLIFFAGPAWLAGDKVQDGRGNGPSKVISGNKEYEWVHPDCPFSYRPKEQAEDKQQQAKWLESTDDQIKKSIKLMRNTPLVYGTAWEPAINMALRMDPRPDVIFFMTDGHYKERAMSQAEMIGDAAMLEGTVIHTIAMMEPKARDPMLLISELTGGNFTLIWQDGIAYDKDGKPVEVKPHVRRADDPKSTDSGNRQRVPTDHARERLLKRWGQTINREQ